MYTADDHTFAVCAYGESPYLSECIDSLLEQSPASRIIVVTSTPHTSIQELCSNKSIRYIVTGNEPSISGDWNFAISSAATTLVTIAHQDDIYCKDYLSEVLDKMNSTKDPAICFTNYSEIKSGQKVSFNTLLAIKRLLLTPFKIPVLANTGISRFMALGFGCAICCPSVTLDLSITGTQIFSSKYKCDLDWDAWERLSRDGKRFCYCDRPLMYHRIHPGSETTNQIENEGRSKEDFDILSRFWRGLALKAINKLYSSSTKFNK